MTSPPRTIDDVPGWFEPADRALFSWILARQRAGEPPGDLVEMGTYMGKSAIGIGHERGPGERFTVCDLFGAEAPDENNRRETRHHIGHLTREAFERNYLAFHDALPDIVQGPTSSILEYVGAGTCRFVHLDASHLYHLVRADIAAARTMLRPSGVAVLNGYRTEHGPGNGAAIWEAFLNDGLHAICLTADKFYGTWGDAGAIQDALLDWLDGHSELSSSHEQIAGQRVVRVYPRR